MTFKERSLVSDYNSNCIKLQKYSKHDSYDK